MTILALNPKPTPQPAARPVPGLEQMAEARRRAHDCGSDRWQFALNIDVLCSGGMSRSDLRWLVCMGYAEHARETTSDTDTARMFQPGLSLAFSDTTCFALTEAGVAYAADLLDAHQAEAGAGAPTPAASTKEDGGVIPFTSAGETKVPLDRHPRWDAGRREVRLGADVVKRYKVPSPNQESILAAFQEEGWPSRIDDPLPPCNDQEPKARLHDTIKRMNRGHRMTALRFYGDGTGEGVCWKLVAPPAARRTAGNGRRRRAA